jgi:hypothetical protein
MVHDFTISIGRVQEAKTTLESGLSQPAITDLDDATKQTMRRFLADVNTQLETAAPTTVGRQLPAHYENDRHCICCLVGLFTRAGSRFIRCS